MNEERVDVYLEQQDQAQRDWDCEPLDRVDQLCMALTEYNRKHPKLATTLELQPDGSLHLLENGQPVLGEDAPIIFPSAWEAIAFLK